MNNSAMNDDDSNRPPAPDVADLTDTAELPEAQNRPQPRTQTPTQPAGGGRPARPRSSTLLDDRERATFLAEWRTVQTTFAVAPERAADTAQRLVGALADSVVRRVGEITDAVGRPKPDPSSAPADSGPAGVPVPDEETWRQQLLRCREAFRLLIDS